MPPHLLIESSFSVERRFVTRREFNLLPQPDFRLIHLLSSPASALQFSASFLANPNQPGELTFDRARCELLIVRIAPELLIETATKLRLYRNGSHLLFRSPLVPFGDSKLSGVMESIAGEIQAGATGWREMIASSINQLAVYLLRAHVNVVRSDETELSRVGIVDRRLRRAVEFMHDNCGRELALAEIAAAAYLSEFHFARLFKKLTGSTPRGYLANLRIERARRLLAESDLAITEVGAQVGYASQSHFTKVFREATGLTPHAFRRAAWREETH